MGKKIAALVLLIGILTACCGLAQAEEALSVSQTACSIIETEGVYLIYSYAQVHNNSDQVVCLAQGTYELTAGGESLGVYEVEEIWPDFLSPDADGYLSNLLIYDPEEQENGDAPAITGLTYDLETMSVSTDLQNYDLEVTAEFAEISSGDISVQCRIKNTTEEDAWNPIVVYGLYTSGGSLVYCEGKMLDNIALPAGSEIITTFTVSGTQGGQWKSYGAFPTEIKALASYRIDTD